MVALVTGGLQPAGGVRAFRKASRVQASLKLACDSAVLPLWALPLRGAMLWRIMHGESRYLTNRAHGQQLAMGSRVI